MNISRLTKVASDTAPATYANVAPQTLHDDTPDETIQHRMFVVGTALMVLATVAVFALAQVL